MEKNIYKFNYQLEKDLWWFKARLNIIKTLFLSFIFPTAPKKLLDFGAGTGLISSEMNHYLDVVAIDNHQETQRYNHFPVSTKELSEFSSEQFDVITAFDSLEHCADDEKILAQFNRILKPGGFIFITVPAFQSLWSFHDETHHHYRRYNKKELLKKVAGFSFTPVKISYFNFFLFPLFVLAILFTRLKEKLTNETVDTIHMMPFFNSLFFHIFNIETKMLQKHNFFCGSSLLFIGRKSNT